MNDQEKTMAEISRQHYISLWKLTTDGDKFYTNCSLLQPVIYKGNKAILKIPMEAEERQGSLMMAWFNGDGAAKVFAYTHNALLLERLSGSDPTLTEMVNAGQDIEASRIICAVLKKLHAPRLQKPRFDLAVEYFRNHKRKTELMRFLKNPAFHAVTSPYKFVSKPIFTSFKSLNLYAQPDQPPPV